MQNPFIYFHLLLFYYILVFKYIYDIDSKCNCKNIQPEIRQLLLYSKKINQINSNNMFNLINNS
jgi:hypothetical protein